MRHGNSPSRSFFRIAYIHVGTFLFSCGRRGVNRCDGFSVGRAIEIQEAKITVAPSRRVTVAVAFVTINGGTEINAKQSNFSCNLTAIFVSAKHVQKEMRTYPDAIFICIDDDSYFICASLYLYAYFCVVIFSKYFF